MKSVIAKFTLILLAALVLVACAEPFTIEGIVGGSVDPATVGSSWDGSLTIAPSSVSLYVEQTLEFSVYGGTGPYGFAVTTNNSGSPGMTGAVYTAGVTPGIDTVTVTDSLGDSAQAEVTVAILPLSTSIDYAVAGASVTVSDPAPYSAGTTVNGEFSFGNIGTADGGYPVDYSIYASTNTALGPQDYLVVSGSTSQLVSGGSATVSFTNGFWPAVADTYYLIVHVESLDDNITDNNSGTSGSTYIVGP